MRSPTEGEAFAVRLLADKIDDEVIRAQLLEDFNGALVEEAAPDHSRLLFHVVGIKRGTYRGQDSFRGADGFPVEGTLTDRDGAAVEVYIYHADGRLLELELLRPDGHHVIEPLWQAFRVK